MRVAVYTDYVYRRDGDALYAGRAFALFLARLAAVLDGMVLVGRVEPRPGRWHYRLPDAVELVGLPHYDSGANARAVIRATAGSLRRFWRALDDVDCAWLLGPYPLAVLFVALARLRGRRVVLGVRQDMPRYVALRHPGRYGVIAVTWALEAIFRLLARRCDVIVVGPELAHHYRHARRLLELTVSLVEATAIVSPAVARERDYDGELTLLSVGRLDAEKDPLALAEVLAELATAEPGRWRLQVAGEGPLRDALAARLTQRGIAERAELLGYLPLPALGARYRACHVLLHLSSTEGLPQVLFEAFAAGLPVIASAVGGIPAAVGDAAVLIEPGDVRGAIRAARAIAADSQLRERLIDGGLALARRHTLESECERVASFLRGGAPAEPATGMPAAGTPAEAAAGTPAAGVAP